MTPTSSPTPAFAIVPTSSPASVLVIAGFDPQSPNSYVRTISQRPTHHLGDSDFRQNDEQKRQPPSPQQQRKYQNLVIDYSFKRVFKQERFLIPFLNELLQGKEKIESVEYLDTHNIGDTPDDRAAIFDVYCKTEKGEQILLEMQNFSQEYFLERSIYYSSFLIKNQGVKGDWNYNLKTMYIIGVLNFIPAQMRLSKSPICRVKLMDIDTKEVFSEKLNFFYLTLPKFSKCSHELKTPLDYWLYILIHSQPNREIDENVLMREQLFCDLLDAIDLNNLNKSEMKKYQASEMTYESFRRFTTGHYNEGIEKGMQQGKTEGRQEERQQTALNALKEGLPLQIVSKITNLSVSEIEKLKSRR